ncbi:ABC transporter substrate-binding protein [Methylobacterium currus]|uniref:ABC transporter substrate-binding protein n=1 Tax=Methylobacterium currus TaxID=2051553 RepID=A0A2R4WSW4_9HYPH|nr:TRAP transporter substrate-binding protein [Methylobacterium currus]AWB24629.1 ABC transporter substrate-binding protein [Methylobacterium currus]UHC19136.1 TRAP transporter substrate-binding protein [Methylobacterium currus]
MHHVTRRSLLAGATAAAILPAPWVRAQSGALRLKCGVVTPDTHPATIRLREAAERVARETNGAVEVAVFPNGQLGSDTDMLSQLRSGALEMFAQSSSNLATLVPRASLINIAFAWSGYDKVWPAVDGELGAYIRAEITKAGLVPFDRMWDNGFRQTTTSVRPITGPADFEGLKLRVPNSALFTSAFRALGAAPVALNFSEAYSALQTKVVDGQENPLAIITSFKLAEVQKYLSFTNHIWDGFWLMSGHRTWSRLPEDVKAVLARHFDQAALDQRRDIEGQGVAMREALGKAGFAINDAPAAPFQDRLRKAGFYTEWKGKYGAEAWSHLEKFAGAVS